jgi:hypothetical protein
VAVAVLVGLGVEVGELVGVAVGVARNPMGMATLPHAVSKVIRNKETPK